MSAVQALYFKCYEKMTVLMNEKGCAAIASADGRQHCGGYLTKIGMMVQGILSVTQAVSAPMTDMVAKLGLMQSEGSDYDSANCGTLSIDSSLSQTANCMNLEPESQPAFVRPPQR